ncbi:MAG: MarR family transcriptional regulator [Clostridia bacterium]|nr:MarR family transcriptional regulator [Clostridia bacterium]
MEKTKDQILIEKLRKAGHRTRMGMHHGPGMPPPDGMRPPMIPGIPFRGPGMRGPADPGMGRPPMGMPPMPREMLLMVLLEADENGIRQKDLGEKMGINASSLSEQIDRLESDHYLERRANPDDRRSTLIVLTEKGRARAWEVQDERRQAAAGFCSGLTEEEKDTLIRLLDKLLDERMDCLRA